MVVFRARLALHSPDSLHRCGKDERAFGLSLEPGNSQVAGGCRIRPHHQAAYVRVRIQLCSCRQAGPLCLFVTDANSACNQAARAPPCGSLSVLGQGRQDQRPTTGHSHGWLEGSPQPNWHYGSLPLADGGWRGVPRLVRHFTRHALDAVGRSVPSDTGGTRPVSWTRLGRTFPSSW